jgi:hypothetical protein
MKTRLAILTVSLAIFAVPQDLTPEARTVIERRVNIQRMWGTKSNSAGASLTAKEIRREKQGDLDLVSYELYATGLPQDAAYNFFVLPLNANQVGDGQVMGQVHLEKSGRVIDGPNDPRVLILPNAAPGEPFRFALLSEDGVHRAAVSIQPNPIEGKDGACTISVIRLMPKFELAYVSGSGFAPGSEIEFKSDSSGETQGGKLKADENGTVYTALLPFVKGKSKGTTNLQMVAPQCKPAARFNWGTTD